MSNQDTSLYQSAKKIWRTVVKEKPNRPYELELQLELHKRLLHLFQPGTYYYYIFNIFQAELEFVSPSISHVLGYIPEEMDILRLLDILHPQDKPYFLEFERRITEFFVSLPFEKIPKYKMQYDLRMRAKNGSYIRLLHQAVQIDYDEKGYYRTLDIDTDITHIKPEGTPCFSIIGLDGEPSYFNISTDVDLRPSTDPFTPKEREVLKLVISCFNSKEIAEALFISPHTVNAHRKNILRKAQVRTPQELIRKAFEAGWV
ncbi:PAS domain-containing protein [Pedobacter sp. HDW13]|uniref:LuxR C-terminal-related transcriptional regulator n=1 Tax=Pedobacter sp. HDW13 TaxID=2714940 RepID=UPI00140B80CC|nr:LuxR C-terminal-related transcriptional regulator [Pedobacter sp. HDW13]QIL40558.1 PAS domain-containing protein [Pedobacter sp. HDW13]